MAETILTIHAPDRSYLDEAIDLRISGAPAAERVTLTATLEDDDGAAWTARATFVADESGIVDPDTQPPVSGSYEGIAPMGWCWSMTSDADTPTAALGDSAEHPVSLHAATATRDVERSITRVVSDEGVTAHPVGREGLVGTWYEPSGAGPHPGVVTLHGSGGRRSDRVAKLLATRGFATLALSFVGEAEALPDSLAGVPLSTVDRAVSWFLDRPAVRGSRVGLFGVSRGGELALLAGARSEWAGAVVSYAGSGVVYDTPTGDPAWVAEGEPVPHISGVGEPERMADGEVVTRPVLERGFDQADEDALAAAMIPVERIDGPVLVVSGGDDRVWPAQRLSAVAADRLTGHDYAATHLTDDDVGHLVGVPYVPLADFDRGGGTTRATARLGVEAWATTLDYLDRGLRGN